MDPISSRKSDGGMIHIKSFVPTGKKYILLGGPSVEVSGLNLEGNIGADCDAIILLKHIEPRELATVLARAPDPAVPVVDFFGNHPVRSDFRGTLLNEDTAVEMQQALTPVWRRLAEFPYTGRDEDRAALTILRLAYSRDAPAKAAFDPGYPLTVQYPLVGTGAGVREQLEFLANHDLLRRRHFTRTHACSKCGSARLHVYEACPACGGADLIEEVLVHHYRCGCQESEARFVQGGLLVCPKCHRVLRHIGVDYDKPGKIIVCRTCGTVNSQPHVQFVCLDCSMVTPAESAAKADWYHYDLTAKGLSTLREGRLPQFELTPMFEQNAHAYSKREFALLAMQEMRVARQFRRPFAVARVSFMNLEAVRRDLGVLDADGAIRKAVDAIVGAVGASDFVGIGSATSIVIGCPGLTSADFDIIESRIRKTIHDTIVAPFELEVAVAEGEKIIELLKKG